MSVVLIIDSIKCINFLPGPNPPSAVSPILWELLVEVDDEPQIRHIEGGIQKGETRPVIDRNALVPFTDRVKLTLRQERPGIGVFEDLGSVVVTSHDDKIVHQFTRQNAHFELAYRVIPRD